MALEVKPLPREFLFRQGKGNTRPLADPGASMGPEEVRAHYSAIYPEMASAGIEGPESVNGVQRYVFSGSVGTKG